MTEDLKKIVIKNIKEIKNSDDFKSLLERYKQSNSEHKFEAIQMVENAFPQYKDCSQSILAAKAMAKESEPDYEDIG